MRYQRTDREMRPAGPRFFDVREERGLEADPCLPWQGGATGSRATGTQCDEIGLP